MPKIPRLDTIQIVHILNISRDNRELLLPLYADLYINNLTDKQLYEKIRKLLKHNKHVSIIKSIIASYLDLPLHEFYDWYLTNFWYDILSDHEETVKDMRMAILSALTVGQTDDEIFDEISRFVITTNIEGTTSQKQFVRGILISLVQHENLPSYMPFTGRTDDPEYAPIYSKIQQGGTFIQSLLKKFFA